MARLPIVLILCLVLLQAQKRTVPIPVEVSRFGKTYEVECAVAASASNPITALAFEPGSRRLAAGGYGEVLVWDLDEAKLVRRIGLAKFGERVRSIAYSADGKSMVVATGTPGGAGALVLVRAGVVKPLETAAGEFLSTAFSGQYVAGGAGDGKVRIWNAEDGSAVKLLEGHAGAVNSVAFTGDGKLLASGGSDRAVRVWKTADWSTVTTLPNPLTEPVNAVAFNGDGSMLAFVVGGPGENAVRLWLTAAATEDATDTDARAAVRRAALLKRTRAVEVTGTPLALAWAGVRGRPRILAGTSENKIVALGPAGGPSTDLAGHTDWVYSLALSGDATTLASGSGDGTVRVWNAVDGRLMATLVHVTAGKEDWAMVTPDGHYAASPARAVQWKDVPEEFTSKLRDADAVRAALKVRPARRPR